MDDVQAQVEKAIEETTREVGDLSQKLHTARQKLAQHRRALASYSGVKRYRAPNGAKDVRQKIMWALAENGRCYPCPDIREAVGAPPAQFDYAVRTLARAGMVVIQGARTTKTIMRNDQ